MRRATAPVSQRLTETPQRTMRKRDCAMSEPIYSPGLEGVVAGETAVSTIEGGLRYRGYPVGELVEQTGFEEVAFLLLHGELPNRAQLASFQQRLAGARSLPAPLLDLFRVLPPAANPM